MSEAAKDLKANLARAAKATGRGLKATALAIGRGIALFMRSLKQLFHKVHLKLHKAYHQSLRHFTKWIDPRLEPYRTPAKTSASVPAKAEPAANETATAQPEPKTATSVDLPVPKSQADFLKILQMTPRDVLDYRARQIITMAFQLPKTHASDLMLPKSKITYVHDDEVLGPLTLDRLYKTGFDHFPVIDQKDNVIGTVHTTSFNNLEIKETSLVRDILDPSIYYIRGDYTLEQVLAAFLRTNCYFFLVVDGFGRTIGMLTFARLISFLFGDTITDHFQRDNDRLAVAKRRDQ